MLLHEVRQLHSSSGSSGGLQSATKVPSMPGGMVLLQFAHTSAGIALIKSFIIEKCNAWMRTWIQNVSVGIALSYHVVEKAATIF